MEEMRLADERLNVLEHPLIAHKMSIMRDGSTAPSQFRQLVHEVAMLEVYEASRDLATEPVEVETLCGARWENDYGREVCCGAHPSRGMGMLDLVLCHTLCCGGVLGMERDEQTHQPHEYYAKMPRGIADRTVFLIDPMLIPAAAPLFIICESRAFATSISGAGGCPEGVRAVLQEDPAFGRARWMTG